MALGRRLSSKRPYAGRILAVDLDEVEEPGGVRVVRDVVRHRGSVAILPITDDDRVVLVRQYRYPVDEMLWEIPAGRLDPGEQPALRPSASWRKRRASPRRSSSRC